MVAHVRGRRWPPAPASRAGCWRAACAKSEYHQAHSGHRRHDPPGHARWLRHRPRGRHRPPPRRAAVVSPAGRQPHLVPPRQGAETPFGRRRRDQDSITVAAVFEVGMSEFDAGFVYLPLTGSAGLFRPRRRCQRRGGFPPIPKRSTRARPRSRLPSTGR
jgi:hypothetical protein